jgi:hypothetical protein
LQVALDNHLWGIFVLAHLQYPHAFFSARCLVVVLAEFILFIRFRHVFVGAELQRNIMQTVSGNQRAQAHFYPL